MTCSTVTVTLLLPTSQCAAVMLAGIHKFSTCLTFQAFPNTVSAPSGIAARMFLPVHDNRLGQVRFPCPSVQKRTDVNLIVIRRKYRKYKKSRDPQQSSIYMEMEQAGGILVALGRQAPSFRSGSRRFAVYTRSCLPMLASVPLDTGSCPPSRTSPFRTVRAYELRACSS